MRGSGPWRIKEKAVAFTVGALGLALTVGASAPALAASPSTGAESYTVMIGGSSANGNIASYNYYPDVVTIDAGDSVTWVEGLGAHTVMIAGPGAKLPPPGSPPVFKPSGGHTFNGTGLDQSGVLMPGQTYTLKFTKPGVYQYQCGLHPDMVGAIVVQPAGAVRPMSPSQALDASLSQLQIDLNAGEQTKAAVVTTTTKAANGSTIYHVNTDLSSPASWTVPLTSPTGVQVGFADLWIDSLGQLKTRMSVMGQPNAAYTADIQIGTADSAGPVAADLNGIKANAKGMGESLTILPKMHAIPGNIWFIALRSDGTLVASAQVNYPQFGSLRYYPSTITVHVGDSIIWTQNDAHEAHTVTILAPGQSVSAADKYTAVKKGGNVVNGPGFYNSGLLWQGMTYELTFTKPGTYSYRCLLHDDEGMLGTVKVLP